MSQVTLEPVDPLKLYNKTEVASRAGYSLRTLTRHSAMPGCPLKFKKRIHGRELVCEATVLASYLNWLLTLEAA